MSQGKHKDKYDFIMYLDNALVKEDNNPDKPGLFESAFKKRPKETMLFLIKLDEFINTTYDNPTQEQKVAKEILAQFWIFIELYSATPEGKKYAKEQSMSPQSISRQFTKPIAETISKYTDLYQYALYFLGHTGGRAQQLFKYLDMFDLVNKTKTNSQFSNNIRTLSNIDPILAVAYAHQVKIPDQWLEFNESVLDNKTIVRATEIATILHFLNAYFPKEERWKKARARLQKKFSIIKISPEIISTVKTFDDIQLFYKKIGAFADSAPDLYQRINLEFLRTLDFSKLIRSTKSGKVDIKALESIRLSLNEVNKILGDEFIYCIGAALTNEPVTKANFSSKLEEVKEWFSQPSGYEDVNYYYESIGRFYANRLVDFFQKNEKLFSPEEKKLFIETLNSYGFQFDTQDPWYAKMAAAIGQGKYGYALRKPLQKGIDKLSSGNNLSQEIINAKLTFTQPSQMQPSPGFGFFEYHDQSKQVVAQVVRSVKGSKAEVSYHASVGTGVDVDSLKEEYGSSMVALSVGTFTAGERKLAGLAAINGNLVNYLITPKRDGLAIFYPDGTAGIKSIPQLKDSDIITPGFSMDNNPINLDRFEDFSRFTEKVRRSRTSIMQGQLLVYEGKLAIASNSSDNHDHRRAFAIMNNGTYALIDFNGDRTLLEEAVLAQKMGVRSLVNLDTGMYDFSQFIDAKGVVHKLGTFDSERPSNVIVLSTGQKR